MKILLFIVLKIVEIGGLIFIPYFLGKLATKYMEDVFGDLEKSRILCWIIGWPSILIIILVCVIGNSIVPEWFKMNWNIVNQIIN